MLQSFLSLSIRHLIRHRFYAFLNILGLSVGVGCLIIAVLFFDHHLQYNAGHEHADRIYRIGRHVTDAEGAKYTMGGHSVSPTLKAEIPQIEEAARILNRPMIIRAGDRSFTERVAVIDTSFTRILTVNMAVGDAESGLLENGACFISQSLSAKLFPEGDPLGRTISISYKWLDGEFKVAGILKDIPDNNTYPLQYQVLTATFPPNDFWRNRLWETWPSSYFSWPIWNFVKLREGTDPEGFHEQLEAFSDRHPGVIEGKTIRYFAQPLNEAHLYTQRDYGIGEGEDINRCLAILGIGLLVLFLACLNYVNLVTAQSPLRSREVGLRKVSGALRHHLIGQFLGESILFASLAFVFALILTSISLPSVGAMLGIELDLNSVSPAALLLIPAVILGVGLMAGLYPAFVLSSHAPARTVQGSKGMPGRFLLRRALVAFQFTASGILIVGTLVVHQQIDYALNKDLGFYHDRVVFLPMVLRSPNRGAMRQKLETVRNEYKALPGVTHASGTFLRPGRVSYVDVRDVIPEGQTGKRRLHYMGTDEEFFDTFEVPIVAGGLPNPDQIWRQVSDTEGIRSIMINERAAEVLGWKGDAVGKRFYEDWTGGDGRTFRRWSEVTGVVRDYHNESLHAGIRPMLIDVAGSVKFVAVRLGKGDITETMAGIEAVWDKFMDGIQFEYHFADELIQDRYEAELQLRQILRFFSGLSIFVGCLGVLGLVSFTAQQRTKEIGIRKVLGSDNFGIVRLLSTDFVRLSLVSFLVAWPIAYIIGADWLSSFAYRVDMGLLPFATSGAFILGLLAITVGIQSWRSATQDPVISLRQE